MSSRNLLSTELRYCSNVHDHSFQAEISASRVPWSNVGGFGNNFHQDLPSSVSLLANACVAALAAAAADSAAATILTATAIPSIATGAAGAPSPPPATGLPPAGDSITQAWKPNCTHHVVAYAEAYKTSFNALFTSQKWKPSLPICTWSQKHLYVRLASPVYSFQKSVFAACIWQFQSSNFLWQRVTRKGRGWCSAPLPCEQNAGSALCFGPQKA